MKISYKWRDYKDLSYNLITWIGYDICAIKYTLGLQCALHNLVGHKCQIQTRVKTEMRIWCEQILWG